MIVGCKWNTVCVAVFVIFGFLMPHAFAAEPDLHNPGVIIKFCATSPIMEEIIVEGRHPQDVPLDYWFFYRCPDHILPLSPFSRISVLINAPAWNTDPYKIDTIGDNTQSPITVYSRGEKVSLDSVDLFTGLPCTGFTELGTDSGLFQGDVRLSGFPIDLTGNGEFDTTPFHGVTTCTSSSAIGFSEAAVVLRTEKEGGVTVAWKVSDDFTILKSIDYTFRKAQVNFEKSAYTLDEQVTVVMRDIDYTLWPQWERRPWTVNVFSDSDTAGTEVKVFWDWDRTFPKPYYSVDSFYGKLILTDTGESLNSGKLRVSPGDQIYVEFDDYSLPSPYGDGDFITVRDTARVIFSNENPSGISLNSVLSTGVDGESINEVQKGAKIQIKAMIETAFAEEKDLQSPTP